MRVLLVPLVAGRRDVELLAGGHEDRVVAEALAAARLAGDPALEDPGAADLLPVRRDRDELRDVACTPSLALDALQLREQAANRVVAAEAGREDARRPSQPRNLDARVLTEHPGAAGEPPAVLGLAAGIRVVGVAVLGRVLVSVEHRQVPAVEHALELAHLVRVVGSELRRQSAQRTSSTFSTSAIRSTSSRASSSRRSSSVSWTLRRLSSRVISRLSIRASAPSTASITRAATRRPGSGRAAARSRPGS